ncbi:MAG: hypothetical protein ACFFAJ_14715 [Candidatus Hodarchaeota archaeon]
MKIRKKILSGNIVLLILIFMSLGVVTPSNAANSANMRLEIEWEHYFGGSEGDAAHSIIQSSDGGFTILGLTESYGAGRFDIWLIKTNASGHHEWNKTFGGIHFDWPSKGNSLIQTQDDGYAFKGYTQGWNESGQIANEKFLMKTDSKGIQKWNYTVEGSAGSTVIQTTDSGYVLLETINRDNESETQDLVLLKIDSSGNYVWNQTIYTFNGEVLVGPLIQTIDGGYTLLGSLGEYPDHDFLLIKIDSAGLAEWNKTYSRKNFNVGASVIQLADGCFILAGTSGYVGYLSTGYAVDNSEIWLIKTDVTGDPVWNTTLGFTSSNEEVTSMIQTADGGFLLAGITDKYSVDSAWLAKTDSDGKLEWEMKIGEDNKHVIESVLQTADGGYVLAGSTGNPLHGGAGDMWLLKVQVTEGTTTTTDDGSPGFEFSLVFLCLVLIILTTRKRRLV